MAPAKLNLALSVGAPMATGMHAIASWMVTIDLCDEVTIARLPHDRLSRYAVVWHRSAKVKSEIDWPLRSDLAVQAHCAREEQIGRSLPVQMTIEKRIPVGAGLGGGSSDAAAALRGLNSLFELQLSDAKLRAIGRRLGSDVPFLLRGGSAIVEGIGEELEVYDALPGLHAVVVLPDFSCSTAAVYAAFDDLGPAELRAECVRRLAAQLRIGPDDPFNDLTPAAMHIATELRPCIASVAALAERPAHLTGSGSAFFVICDDPIHAEALAAAIESQLKLAAVAVQAWKPLDSP